MITLRFQDIVRYKPSTLIVGAGATGSWLAYILSRMGCSITIVDDDTVEEHNIGTGTFSASDIGKKKVYALAEKLNIKPVDARFSDEMISDHECVVAAVDNMKTRKQIFTALDSKPVALVDMRVHYPYGMVYTLDNSPSSRRLYETTLYSDEEAWQGECTRQNTPYLSALVASIAARHITQPIRGITVTVVDMEKMEVIQI